MLSSIKVLYTFIIMKKLSIIVATENSNGIGYKNTIPWKLPEDMKHFQDTTMGCAVIFGKNTYDSIPKKLYYRTTVVLSSKYKWPEYSYESNSDGVVIWDLIKVSTFDDAFEMLDKYASDKKIFVAGGQKLYDYVFKFNNTNFTINEVYQTKINIDKECDTTFNINMDEFKKEFELKLISTKGINYTIIKYV